MKSVRARNEHLSVKELPCKHENNLRSGFVTFNAEEDWLRMGRAQRNEDEIFPQ